MTMTIEEYLRPDPNIRPPVPTARLWTPPSYGSPTRRISMKSSKGSARATLVANSVRIMAESNLEKKAMLAALADPNTAGLREQYPRQKYVGDDGETHTHTFDFLVLHKDGSRTANSVKPLAFVESSGIARILKLLAAQMSPATADRVNLVTERNLGRTVNFNAELIHAVRRDPSPAADDAIIAGLVDGLIGSTTVRALVAASGLKGYGYRAVARLIADGCLCLTRSERITYDAVVRRADLQA
jgi:hypothetical protein